MRQHSPIEVSIIVVSWNTREHLSRCLRALPQAAGALRTEVIVVDNGSTDGTQAMLAQSFPDVRLIQNHENHGYGKAINIGVAESLAEAFLILNSDCELAPDALREMVNTLDRNPSLGIVCCRLANADGSLQPSVHRALPSPWSTLGDLFHLSSIRYAVYRCPRLHPWLLRPTIRMHQSAQEVAWGGGACLLVRRKAFDTVGGFDEAFFMYCEDMDLCQRIQKAGYRIWYLPGPYAIHHWGRSTRQDPQRMIAAAFRSRILYFEKHFPGWGGALTRWTAKTELRARYYLWQALSLLPSRSRPWWRDRARDSQNCLRALEEDPPLDRLKASAPTSALLFFLMIVAGLSLISYLHQSLKALLLSPFLDFAHYYTYATVVSLGLNAFDPSAIAQVDQLLNIRRAGALANYPPPFYLLMQPWTWLPYRMSSLAWFLMSHLCLFGSLAIVLRQCGPPTPTQAVAAMFVILNFQPLIETIALGQANVMVLLLLTAAWASLRGGKTWLTAAATTLAFSVKVQFVLLVPLLWWIGQRAAAYRTIVLALGTLAVSLTVLGSNHHLQYTQYILNLPDYIHVWTANLSPRATLHRLLATMEGGSLWADALWFSVSTAVLVLFARRLPRHTESNPSALDWAWSLGLTAVLLLSPLTHEHHLVVLLLPLTLMILKPAGAFHRGTNLALLVTAIILIGSRYSFAQLTAMHQGILSLFMTGKLLGIVLLATLLIRSLGPVRLKPR